ncbi:hypothetical protein [Frigoribacterium sp. RIT-PI-h]|uniref:hypothetical protein n=1 Tax=Frigoribacterium sp. RIT-PI-h TaxID=1690245 RepID=UPI0006B8855D|nr:hypothetical protein [Frigoribacterium sp. RIT-PI-h]KPG81469.1 hypothetical protein AEQ27_11175 [Frigoribacterium sp. RIT-PI-h]
MGKAVVLLLDDPRRAVLEVEGWSVAARSFGAQLDALRVDRQRLQQLVAGVERSGSLRELTVADVDAVLSLDAATFDDYPGSVATRHERLDRLRATPSVSRRAFGVFLPAGELVAMTFVDVEGVTAETNFTVVRRDQRGRGLGLAVKACSVLALLSYGVTRFRTGGSADNAVILRANDAMGYIRDEEWVTLEQDAR